jgi:hypothetical protein
MAGRFIHGDALMVGWRAVVAAGLAVVVTALPMAARPAAAVPAAASEMLCAAEAARSERTYGIPKDLLDAVSRVESGRYDAGRRATIAWPWTVTAEGQGRYLPTKAEAVAEVKRLKAKGVKNIDVGCMQVNLQYHPDAFTSLDEAFEPASNVAYAARFLKGLYGATNHWPTAASYYHSQTPSLAAAYRERLMKAWTGAGTQLALASPSPKIAAVPHSPPLKPVPGSPRVEEMRKTWRDQNAGSRDESRRIADAYRQARLAEYQFRRTRFVEARSSAPASSRR